MLPEMGATPCEVETIEPPGRVEEVRGRCRRRARDRKSLSSQR
jgi:hypothetical protein